MNIADGNTDPATMASSQAIDVDGKSLDGNGYGTAGDVFVYDFFHLRGDLNGDRKVGNPDFKTLYEIFDESGKTYRDGDLNFDGKIDFNNTSSCSRSR